MLSSILLILTGCNQYEYFNIAGYEQANFSNDADILFVIDNSSSMRDEATALGENFNVFIDLLTSEAGGTESTETLDDAVDSFVTYVTDRGKFIDYQLGITTTSVDYTTGVTTGVDPGETGLLLGNTPVIDKYDPEVETKFKRNLLCEATYWERHNLPSDPAYECGQDATEISIEYLDCLCDNNDWDGRAGSGNEEPLEAALLAICRSVDDPPEVCYEPISAFTEADEGSNPNFIRDDSTIIVVIVGDEGDNSRRLQQGEEVPVSYQEAFESFNRRIKFVTIGPNYDKETGDFSCNSGGARDWMVERLRIMSEQSKGFFRPLEVKNDSGECQLDDFSVHLEELGALLNNLETAFQLKSIPDTTTIRVYVNGVSIAQAQMENEDEYVLNPDGVTPLYTTGWSYESSQNAVVFWGDAVPDYNSNVRIYYRPLAGTPRDLPFSY